jgi:RNA polymerase sigma-70 factor (ECF subfamily)
MDVLDDREIIHRCQCGQTHLMDLLVDRYKDPLYSLCMKLARNGPDADDLFQDTWVNAMKKIDSFSLDRKFSPWLFGICVNRYRDRYRWRTRWLHRLKQLASGGRIEHATAGLKGDAPTPDEILIMSEKTEAVRKAIDGLEDKYRLPVILHYYHGYSMEEIGNILDIPSGTVKSQLSRGRQLLKRSMEDGSDE